MESGFMAFAKTVLNWIGLFFVLGLSILIVIIAIVYIIDKTQKYQQTPTKTCAHRTHNVRTY